MPNSGPGITPTIGDPIPYAKVHRKVPSATVFQMWTILGWQYVFFHYTSMDYFDKRGLRVHASVKTSTHTPLHAHPYPWTHLSLFSHFLLTYCKKIIVRQERF